MELSALLRRTRSKYDGKLYFLNCLYLFRTKNTSELHKKCLKIKAFKIMVMLYYFLLRLSY